MRLCLLSSNSFLQQQYPVFQQSDLQDLQRWPVLQRLNISEVIERVFTDHGPFLALFNLNIPCFIIWILITKVFHLLVWV